MRFDASKDELKSSETNTFLNIRRQKLMSDARGDVEEEELEGRASRGDNIVANTEKRKEQRLKMRRRQRNINRT